MIMPSTHIIIVYVNTVTSPLKFVLASVAYYYLFAVVTSIPELFLTHLLPLESSTQTCTLIFFPFFGKPHYIQSYCFFNINKLIPIIFSYLGVRGKSRKHCYEVYWGYTLLKIMPSIVKNNIQHRRETFLPFLNSKRKYSKKKKQDNYKIMLKTVVKILKKMFAERKKEILQ